MPIVTGRGREGGGEGGDEKAFFCPHTTAYRIATKKTEHGRILYEGKSAGREGGERTAIVAKGPAGRLMM